MVKIAVIGAGINGLACAVKIKEYDPNYEVVLISSEFSPDTTGDGSGGLWYPYICGDTAQHLLAKWGSSTYKFLHSLWLQGGNDVCLIPIYCFYEDTELTIPKWAGITFGYDVCSQRQLDYYSNLYNMKYGSGIRFSTFVVQSTNFLQYLMDRFKKANGKVKQSQIRSMNDSVLKEYDVVVNCSGLGARDIVPDKEVFPVRGQVTKVIAPWANHIIVDEFKGNYIIPNAETCVLGGTHQEHNYDRQVDDNDTEFIINGCAELMPGLQRAKIVNHWAGLRPARHEIRLAAEHKYGKLYIHNYGHGGSGLTLFWGCADEVLEILTEKMRHASKLHNSKL